MKELMSVGEVQTMSSREIAELTGKRHDNVLRDIEKMAKELGVLERLKFEVFEEINNLGLAVQRKAYKLDKEETLILVSGYSVKMRAAIVRRWMELEKRLQLISKIESIDEVAALKKENMRLKAQIWHAEEMAAGERRINDIVCSKKPTDKKIKELVDLAHQNWRMRCEELRERVELEQVVQNHSEKIHALECVLEANMGIEFKQ